MGTDKKARSNRLAGETSPYLLQHSRNPVDWYPWGEEAFAQAKRQGRPIFLSIGYAACHWCHVMERESFEDQETAQALNKQFVAIKVDREERPDVDHVYMQAVQALTQRGGWPLTVFLTPEGMPFFGGTYFPKEDRHGMPSFRRVLEGVATAWTSRRVELEKSATQLTEALRTLASEPFGEKSTVATELAPQELRELCTKAVEASLRQFDTRFGGMGTAPKFFHSMSWRLCLRAAVRGNPAAEGALLSTLDGWSRGGICDQLGGGFHRYSTDDEWLVPHFEKMLYDNGLLAQLFAESYRAFRRPADAETVRDTLDWVLRDMRDRSGAFHATLDADTEGEEGKFYVWAPGEIEAALADKELVTQFGGVFELKPEGNWEGRTVLRRLRPVEVAALELGTDVGWLEDGLATARRKLLERRAERVPPARDEKILVSWNALVIEALVEGYKALGEQRYLDAAREGAEVLLGQLVERASVPWLLRHGTKDGRAHGPGFLDDYAALVCALAELFSVTGETRWLTEAEGLARAMEARFADPARGDYFFGDKTGEKLVVPAKDAHDGAMPSGVSLAATAWAKLAALAGEPKYRKRAEEILRAHAEALRLIPAGVSQLLLVADELAEEGETFVVCEGDDTEGFERVVRAGLRTFVPGRWVVPFPKSSRSRAGIFEGKTAIEGKLTIYRCVGTRCDPPLVGEPAALRVLEGKETP